MNVFSLIRDLGHSGAQQQLTELVKGLDLARYNVTVATFDDDGALQMEIEGLLAVKVVSENPAGGM